MPHMIPEYFRGQVVEVTDGGETYWYPVDLDGVARTLAFVVSQHGDRVTSLVVCSGYLARLSAPGYLDATHWAFFRTRSEAEAWIQESFAVDPVTGDDLDTGEA